MSSTSTSASTLVLPAALRSALEEHARAGFPLETCGLLIGRARAERIEVEAVRKLRNVQVERARERYELDPVEHLAVEDEAAALGLEVVGAWHSHPDHPARPSETDRARAWEGWSYVILAVTAAGVVDLRSWRLVDGDFREERLA